MFKIQMSSVRIPLKSPKRIQIFIQPVLAFFHYLCTPVSEPCYYREAAYIGNSSVTSCLPRGQTKSRQNQLTESCRALATWPNVNYRDD